MTDAEITKACAEAMGIHALEWAGRIYPDGKNHYDPLRDDAQAMALVKKFKPHICFDSPVWDVRLPDGDEAVCDTDLNRAICECVAKLRTPA